jgi:hypothetical protein
MKAVDDQMIHWSSATTLWWVNGQEQGMPIVTGFWPRVIKLTVDVAA